MSKLTNGDKSTLALFERSHKDEKGWVYVTRTLMPLFDNVTPGLFELDRDHAGGYGHVRLTEVGKILVEWVL